MLASVSFSIMYGLSKAASLKEDHGTQMTSSRLATYKNVLSFIVDSISNLKAPQALGTLGMHATEMKLVLRCGRAVH